ncbi:MAG: FAD-binding oxidoreductase [Solirubrobacterales bacterium]|nr:FAD-binding oxidoreductase [Solirubrobacterales bacterium]
MVTREAGTRGRLSRFAGELIVPGGRGYDEARSLYNGMYDKRPTLIARCTSAEDVSVALAYARENGLVVAVRGGGHSTQGFSSCDGGVVIDTGPIKGIAVDRDARTGRFGAGLTWGELDAATQAHGLALTGGRVSHTGIAGLTLGSGSGWLERTLGYTCVSLISAEVVTADGAILRASAEEHPELFWGLRGGGGNFGVVTKFEFRLHRIGPLMLAGRIWYPRAVAGALARFYRDVMEEAPDDIGGALRFVTAPSAEFVPREHRGRPACLLLMIFFGDPGGGGKKARALLSWGRPWAKLVGPTPYLELQRGADDQHRWGSREYSRVDYLDWLPDPAIDALVDCAQDASSPLSSVMLCPLGGAVSRLDRSTVALNTPDTPWMYYTVATWQQPSEDERQLAWARRFMRMMRPWSVGVAPANFIELDEGTARLRAYYGEEKLARLTALKDTYDPDDVFALNQNIPPSARTSGPFPDAGKPRAGEQSAHAN